MVRYPREDAAHLHRAEFPPFVPWRPARERQQQQHAPSLDTTSPIQQSQVTEASSTENQTATAAAHWQKSKQEGRLRGSASSATDRKVSLRPALLLRLLLGETRRSQHRRGLRCIAPSSWLALFRRSQAWDTFSLSSLSANPYLGVGESGTFCQPPLID